MDNWLITANYWLAKAERVFAVFVFFYYTSCLYALITGGQFLPQDDKGILTPADESNVAISLLQWGLYCITLFFAGLRWKYFSPILMKRKCIWGVVLLALASIGWSLVPDLTLRRSIGLLMTTLVAMYFSMRFSFRELMQFLGLGLCIAVVVNFLFVLAFPTHGTSVGVHAGAWRGTLPQKNALARLMVLSAITQLLLAVGNFKYRYLWLGGLLLSVALILLSASKTGLTLLLLLFVLVYIFRGLRWRYTIALPVYLFFFLALSAILVGVVGNQEMILTAMGRDVTLTGRTEIWDIALEKISQRLWVGYGYKSFWLGTEGDSADIFYRMNWQSPNGHNGYLDLLLDLGLVGLMSFLLSFGMSFIRAIAWLRLHSGTEGLYPLACFSYLLLYNITESSLILDSNNIFWLLYVLISTSILIQPIPIESGEKRELSFT